MRGRVGDAQRILHIEEAIKEIEGYTRDIDINVTFSDILQAYPALSEEKIRAALAYAAESLKGDTIYPIGHGARE